MVFVFFSIYVLTKKNYLSYYITINYYFYMFHITKIIIKYYINTIFNDYFYDIERTFISNKI